MASYTLSWFFFYKQFQEISYNALMPFLPTVRIFFYIRITEIPNVHESNVPRIILANYEGGNMAEKKTHQKA